MAAWGVDRKVWSVQDEQEWCQHSSLRGPGTADQPVRDVALCPQKTILDGVISTGEIREHDLHSASRLLQVSQSSVQEVDVGIIHPDAGRLISRYSNQRCSHHNQKPYVPGLLFFTQLLKSKVSECVSVIEQQRQMNHQSCLYYLF